MKSWLLTGDIEVVAEGLGSGLTANVDGGRPNERSIRSPQRFTMTDGTNLPTTVSSPESLPVLSVVVPTLNEERCIEAFLERVSRYLESRTLSWEIVVVDDGSGDATVRLVELWIRRDPRVRLLRQAHGGKGSAVRRGMLEARGAWRFMTDADLSVSPDTWNRLLDRLREPGAADLIVGSREAAGARRIGEPFARRVIGRVFNRVCSAPGFLDSGLKVITSTLPRPVRRNRVALGLDSDSRTSPASTARCTSVETRARRGGVPRSFRSSAPTRDSPLTCG